MDKITLADHADHSINLINNRNSADAAFSKERRDGLTMVWLKPDARITRARNERAAMRFVAGPLRRGFLRSTGFLAMARGQGGGGVGTGGTFVTDDYCCCFTINRGVGPPA